MTKISSVRKDTRLESEGAEFLVLGHLLIEGVTCFKSYTNLPGYDLIAVDAETKKSARIQVKSRWATDYDGKFPIKNFDSDFVVHVALNRGYRVAKSGGETGIRDPEFWVLPTKSVKSVLEESGGWSKAKIRNIPKIENYRNAWHLISKFIG